jgi:hypothetical protein
MNNYIEISEQNLLEEIILTLQNNANTKDLVNVAKILNMYKKVSFNEKEELISIIG